MGELGAGTGGAVPEAPWSAKMLVAGYGEAERKKSPTTKSTPTTPYGLLKTQPECQEAQLNHASVRSRYPQDWRLIAVAWRSSQQWIHVVFLLCFRGDSLR